MNIYEITNGIYSAKINLSRGANCISLRHNKYNATILREPDYSAPLDNVYLYGMPILFPVNRILGGRFTFEGREYSFPINEPRTGCHLHGILHQQEFDITSCGRDFVVCSYEATKDNSYMEFPHEFKITIRYRLTENGLEQETTIKNLSSENMPVMIGFHTTFQIPFVEHQDVNDLRILADVTDLIERDMDTYLPTGNIVKMDKITEQLQKGEFPPFEEKISRHYKSGENGELCILDAKKQIGIRYENSTNMKFRLLYNGNADRFICLEPQNCIVNCVNEEFDEEYTGFEYLRQGEEARYRSKISVI